MPAPITDSDCKPGAPGAWHQRLVRLIFGRRELATNDAARIPQPTYADLWVAYVAGAKSGQKHPDATEHEINRAADAWCKLLHAERDPEGFAAMGQTTKPWDTCQHPGCADVRQLMPGPPPCQPHWCLEHRHLKPPPRGVA